MKKSTVIGVQRRNIYLFLFVPLVLILLALDVAVYNLGVAHERAKWQTSLLAPISSPSTSSWFTDSVETFDSWTTFESPGLGISFKHPSKWVVQPSQNGALELTVAPAQHFMSVAETAFADPGVVIFTLRKCGSGRYLPAELIGKDVPLKYCQDVPQIASDTYRALKNSTQQEVVLAGKKGLMIDGFEYYVPVNGYMYNKTLFFPVNHDILIIRTNNTETTPVLEKMLSSIEFLR